MTEEPIVMHATILKTDSEADAIAAARTAEEGRAWWARQRETGKPAVAITDVPVRSFGAIEVIGFVDATPTAGTITVGHASMGTWQPRSRRQRRASR